jgi:catechol 2,3-dioxygenase-like lactoylglutathione lyase family enzyme
MDKIHHVAIQVNDIKVAVEWYQDKFDTKILYQDDTWALIKFANLSLALVLPDQHPPHFAIENDEAEKFGELTKHRDGTASVYINDPFGNSIEIIKID